MSERPTLYWINGSIPSWQVMLACHLRGVEYESRRLKVMGSTRETRSPEFLAINPRGQAPVWVEPDGTTVCESMAILHWLEASRPETSLCPEGPAMALMLQRMYEVERLRMAYRPLEALFLQQSSLSSEQIEAARAAPARVAQELSIWSSHLEEHPWIAGPALTLADCVFYPALGYQIRRGLILGERWPRLQAYVDRIEARPAAREARPLGWHRVGKSLFARAAAL
ncbi:MAG: glutathione S-transferase family protein [Bradymonadia bacterium]